MLIENDIRLLESILVLAQRTSISEDKVSYRKNHEKFHIYYFMKIFCYMLVIGPAIPYVRVLYTLLHTHFFKIRNLA